MKKLVFAAALALASPMAAGAQTPVAPAADQMALLNRGTPAEVANKKIVFNFWREVFIAGDRTKIDGYLTERYIQHNPAVDNGREGFKTLIARMRPTVQPVPPTIPGLVAILADGDMVVMAFRRELPHPLKPGTTYTTTWFDMFRIQDGKIDEHWDYGTINPDGRPLGAPPPPAPPAAH